MNEVKSESDGEPLVDKDSSRGTLPREAVPRLKKGPWTPSEDAILEAYVKKHGERNWKTVKENTGLLRCGKSCRLRWLNHLRPSLKKGAFTKQEEDQIIKLHYKMGNKWARMAAFLPGRTDNEIKNYWNTRIKKCKNTRSLLYPADVCQQASKASNEDQHESSDFSSKEKLANHPLQENGIYVPGFTYDSFTANSEDLSYPPKFSDVSPSNMFGHRFVSKDYDSMDQMGQVKILREYPSPFPMLNATMPHIFSSVVLSQNQSEKFGQAFGTGCRYMTNSSDNLSPSTAAMSTSHGFSNGHFSASRSRIAPWKMELSSIQNGDFDPNSWPMHSRISVLQPTNSVDVCMPSTVLPSQSECVAPSNNDQSKELEAHTLNNIVNREHFVGNLSSSVGTPHNIMPESSEFDHYDEYGGQNPDFYPLIDNSFCASPLCPASPAQTVVTGQDELIATQYDIGDVSPQLDLWRDADIFQDEINTFFIVDSDKKIREGGFEVTTFPK